MTEKALIENLIEIARQAGEVIMKVYAGDFDVQNKADNSPLTEADEKANNVILGALEKRYPDIPFISEESRSLPYQERKNWKRFWLIDPLDGTKEFIKKNGEFTVNIALIEEGVPVAGVVYAPAKDLLYVACKGSGAFKISYNKKIRIQVKPVSGDRKKITVVSSRSHPSVEMEDYLSGLKEIYEKVEEINIGSSLKICLVAEGKADQYPRLGPTSEWDTAAGHAILKEASGEIIQLENKRPLNYNKVDLLNPDFVAVNSSGRV